MNSSIPLQSRSLCDRWGLRRRELPFDFSQAAAEALSEYLRSEIGEGARLGIVVSIASSGDRSRVYEALDRTEWQTNASVTMAVAHDVEAPIRIVLKIIPFAGLATVQEMVGSDHCNPIVRQRILEYVRTRQVESRKINEFFLSLFCLSCVQFAGGFHECSNTLW